MARPTKYGDPKSRILAKARKLVVSKGFDKVSLRAIADASGFSPAALYEYYPSKEAIFAALAVAANQRLYMVLHRSAAGLDPLPALAALARAYVVFSRENEEDFLLIFRRSQSKRRSLANPVPEGSAYQLVLDRMQRAIASGVFAAGDLGSADGLAYAFWSLVHGQATLQLTTLRGFDADFARYDAWAVAALLRSFAA